MADIRNVKPWDFYEKNESRLRTDRDTRTSSEKEVKLFSNDHFDKTIEIAVGLTEEEGIRSPLILANVGGSDGTLSLYANLANIEGQMPTMIVVDRKPTNLNNFLFRLYLTQIAGGSREAYIRRLFSYEGDGKLSTASEMKKSLLDHKYDPEKHEEELTRDFKALGKDVADFMTGPVEQMLGYMSDEKPVKEGRRTKFVRKANRKGYKFFVEGLTDSITRNPKTHYLTNDDLYRRVYNSIDRGQTPRYRIQTMLQDISTQEGQDAVRRVLDRYGLHSAAHKPIDIGFIPNIKYGMDGAIPFVKENVRYTIRRKVDR